MITGQQAVIECIKESFGYVDQVIAPHSRFEDLGVDSLDLVELIMCFEDEYKIEITDEEAEKLETVADLFKLANITLNPDVVLG